MIRWLLLIAVLVGIYYYPSMGWWGIVIAVAVVGLIAHVKNLYWKWLHRW